MSSKPIFKVLWTMRVEGLPSFRVDEEIVFMVPVSPWDMINDAFREMAVAVRTTEQAFIEFGLQVGNSVELLKTHYEKLEGYPDCYVAKAKHR